MTETDLATELRTAAKLASNAGATGAAAMIETLLRPLTDDDVRRLRRTALRTIRRKLFLGLTRTAAAKAIAAAWWCHANGAPCPDELQKAFDMLSTANIQPLGWRTIADELDVSLDRREPAAINCKQI